MLSLRIALNTLHLFSQISGLKLNYSKTEVLPVNVQASKLKPFRLKIVEKACSLGIWYHLKQDETISENYKLRLNDFAKTLNLWRAQNLTLIGKTTVIKTLAFPKLIHVIANTETPEWFVIETQKQIFDFLWNGKPPKVKNSVIVNSEANGGLKVPQVDIFVKAQKLGWIKRMVLNENAGWLELLKTYMPEMPVRHLLKCNIDPNELSDGLPAFYRQVLYAWYSQNQSELTQPLEMQREYIWLNKFIRVDNQSLFNKGLFDAGVICINDILNADGHFLTYKHFIDKFTVKASHMYYISLIDAIPQKWRQALKRARISLNAVSTEELPHTKIKGRDKPVTLTATREYYWKMMSDIEGVPSCYNAWAERINLSYNQEDWQKIFMLPKQCIRDTRILDMQYKIIHRCYATESIICKWDPNVQENCTKCHKKANIIHNFYLCPEIKQFWQNIEGIAVNNLNMPGVELSLCNVLFGKPPVVHYKLLNHLILHAKYHLHCAKKQNRPISNIHFVNYYKKIVEIEKERYSLVNKMKDFERVFGQVTFE